MKKHIVLIVIMFLIAIISVSIYTYKSGSSSLDTPPPRSRTVEKFQWVKHWDQLDLAAIKRDYQPYTLTEMREMWNEKLIAKYGGHERLKQAIRDADHVYPLDKYLARMLKLGRPFADFSDYENALTEQRIWLFSTRVYRESINTSERGAYLERRGLPRMQHGQCMRKCC